MAHNHDHRIPYVLRVLWILPIAVLLGNFGRKHKLLAYLSKQVLTCINVHFNVRLCATSVGCEFW